MWWRIFTYETGTRFRQISTYVYFVINLLISFLLLNIGGGAIPGANLVLSRSGENIFANSPFSISILTVILSYFGLIIFASVFGNTAVREFEHNSFSLFYSKPVSKFDYVFGKFSGAFITCLFIMSGAAFGLYIATFMPYLDQMKIGPNHLYAYLQPYLLFIIPNIFLTGLIFFFTALFSRKILNSFIAGIVLFIGYMAASALGSDYVNTKLSAMLDPFGINAVMSTMRYWSSDQANTAYFGFSGLIMYNRFLWMGVAIILAILFYLRFKMTYSTDSKKNAQVEDKPASEKKKSKPILKPQKISFNHHALFLQIKIWTKLELKSIFSNLYFYVILVAYLFFLITTATQIGKLYGTVTFPVTYVVLEMLTSSFMLFSIIVSTFYAGELIWKERHLKTDQIIDALPYLSGISFISKFLAIIFVQFIFLIMIILTGISTQVVSGYYQFEISKYLFELFVLRIFSIIVYTLLAMFMQVIFSNKYLSYFAVIGVYGLQMIFGFLDINHNLIKFNGAPGFVYSQMNHYGHFLKAFFAFHTYWLLFSLILGFLALRLWVRGKDDSLKVRFQQLKKEGFSLSMKAITVLGIAFVILGSWIYYNTNILNEFYTSKEMQKRFVSYEKKYKHLENTMQPRVVELHVENDIFPKDRQVNIKGYYWLKNKSQQTIDSLIVFINPSIKNPVIHIETFNQLRFKDDYYGLSIYSLNEKMHPGDSIKVKFTYKVKESGFPNEDSNTELVENGTFYHSDYFPSFGYQSGYELSDNDKRRKYGLPPKERMASINDKKARYSTYISNDSDWIRFESIVSTDSDQIAFAPGNLLETWNKDNRNYYHYKLDAPSLNFFTFVSGRYAVKKDKVNDVNVEIYYHPTHEYNIDNMMNAAKNTLAYCSDNFAPYPHNVLRIIEVPRYVSYAQSIPTMIPFSEGLGFIAKVNPDNPKDVDYPYYITSHEVAHQWWAHQLIGANVQGSTMLSEAFAQYTSLMLMKAKYGNERMGKFLGYELDSYLMGRSNERKKELPLYLVENQQYLHYNKGSLVMYAMQDYIGEQNMNKALGDLCKKTRFQQPPYPLSTDFFPYLQANTPDSLKYLINEFYKDIIIYDFNIKSAEMKRSGQGWQITLKTENKKKRADQQGKEKELPLNQYVDIAVYEKGNVKPIYLKKHLLTGITNITLNVSSKPEKITVNPLRMLIDKDFTNDTYKF